MSKRLEQARRAVHGENATPRVHPLKNDGIHQEGGGVSRPENIRALFPAPKLGPHDIDGIDPAGVGAPRVPEGTVSTRRNVLPERVTDGFRNPVTVNKREKLVDRQRPEPSAVEEAQERVAAAKKARLAQLGSNGYQGN